MLHTMLLVLECCSKSLLNSERLLFAQADGFFTKLEFVGQAERPARRNKRAAVDFLVKVEVVVIKQSIKEVGKRRTVQIFMHSSSWFTHLCQESEGSEDRVFQPQAFLVSGLRADLAALCGDRQPGIHL